jgi:hypothetical protein
LDNREGREMQKKLKESVLKCERCSVCGTELAVIRTDDESVGPRPDPAVLDDRRLVCPQCLLGRFNGLRSTYAGLRDQWHKAEMSGLLAELDRKDESRARRDSIVGKLEAEVERLSTENVRLGGSGRRRE